MEHFHGRHNVGRLTRRPAEIERETARLIDLTATTDLELGPLAARLEALAAEKQVVGAGMAKLRKPTGWSSCIRR